MDYLSSISDGETAAVFSIQNGDLKRRLMDMGFTADSSVTCLYSAPSGDPRAYLVRGTVIAIRRKDAECIFVRRSN